jgi:hypothetical protein
MSGSQKSSAGNATMLVKPLARMRNKTWTRVDGPCGMEGRLLAEMKKGRNLAAAALFRARDVISPGLHPCRPWQRGT